jgi:hypothetical protein
MLTEQGVAFSLSLSQHAGMFSNVSTSMDQTLASPTLSPSAPGRVYAFAHAQIYYKSAITKVYVYVCRVS